MTRTLVFAGFVVLLWAVPAWSQETTDLTTERRQRRLIALPKPAAAVVEQEAARAAEALAARRRLDEVVREPAGPGARRPDLRYDVYSAIQQRNIRRAR